MSCFQLSDGWGYVPTAPLRFAAERQTQEVGSNLEYLSISSVAIGRDIGDVLQSGISEWKLRFSLVRDVCPFSPLPQAMFIWVTVTRLFGALCTTNFPLIVCNCFVSA